MGHIIGKRFGGEHSIRNVIAQDGKVNNGKYKRVENEWARAIKNGKRVRGKIDITYPDNSFRPDQFTMTYKKGIGKTKKIEIPNY